MSSPKELTNNNNTYSGLRGNVSWRGRMERRGEGHHQRCREVRPGKYQDHICLCGLCVFVFVIESSFFWKSKTFFLLFHNFSIVFPVPFPFLRFFSWSTRSVCVLLKSQDAQDIRPSRISGLFLSGIRPDIKISVRPCVWTGQSKN